MGAEASVDVWDVDPESVRLAVQRLVNRARNYQADKEAARACLMLTGVDIADMRDWERRNLTSVTAALAAQRAEIHARYERLAKWADEQADSREHFAKVDPSYRGTLIPYRVMAERIRMAADQ